MNKKKVTRLVDFADSTFKTFQMSEKGDLTLIFNSWQEKAFQVIFINTIQFLFRLGDVPANCYEIDSSQFMEDALMQDYGYIPDNYPYKLFHIVDICDFPFIQIVAESVESSFINRKVI